MGSFDDGEGQTVPQPLGIVGVSGIYDLRLLRDTFRPYTAYQEFIEGAFGSREDIWDRASPAHGDGLGDGWKNGRLALIAHSKGDELIDASQLHTMERALNDWAGKESENTRKVLVVRDLREAHDDIWKDGVELSQVIKTAIEDLMSMEGPAAL